MQSYSPSDPPQGTPQESPSSETADGVSPPSIPTPIAELAGLPDFPQCTLDRLIDIRGYVGVVVSIVNNSIKVRSPEGSTQSFNFHRLRTLYSPVVHPDPVPSSHHAAVTQPRARRAEAPSAAPAPAPKRDLVADPDFSTPIVPISELLHRLDFPKCALGRHVDVAGFKGVVVEIVKQSFKVRSVEGKSRNYNGPLLQQLHKKP